MPIGVATGAGASLVGASGGFLIVPLLLFLNPDLDPTQITGISLTVVACSSVSGTVAYARLKRIDYRAGLLFASVTLPAGVLGAYATHYISRNVFDGFFGVVVILVAAALFRARVRSNGMSSTGSGEAETDRVLTDANGTKYSYSYRAWLGCVANAAVGFVSNLLGVGGGVLRAPTLIHLLHFPPHVATATSQFIISVTALSGVAVHGVRGDVDLGQAVYLAIGVIIGAQIGARVSTFVHGMLIAKLLALALAGLGVRLLLGRFF